MKQTIGRFVILLVAVIAAAGGGYWFGVKHPHESADAESATTQAKEEEKPVGEVETMVLTKGSISETITAYGTITAEPGNVKVISVPFESRVVHIAAAPGEKVEAGAEVVKVEASPDALVALQDAKNAVAATTNDLKQAEQRMNDHLATNQEISQAKQALQSAQLKLDSLVQRGVGESHLLKAEAGGVISKVDAQEGQIIPAGGPLVEIAAADRIQAVLGVQPEFAGALQRDQAVHLFPANRTGGEAIEGKIRLISQRVDPATRLVSVTVALPADSHLMLESFITGEIVRASADGFVLPRAAALPEEDGSYAIFTVKDKHAVKHDVKLGLTDAGNVQVIGEGLAEGDVVVIAGNYQLEDGMEVEVKEPTTEPSTEPKTAVSEKSEVPTKGTTKESEEKP